MLAGLQKIIEFFRNNRKLIIRTTIALVCIFFMLFTDYGFLKTIDLLIDKNDLQEQVNNHIWERDSLNRRIKRLTNDSNEIERIAREHYGLVKKGEQVFISSEK